MLNLKLLFWPSISTILARNFNLSNFKNKTADLELPEGGLCLGCGCRVLGSTLDNPLAFQIENESELRYSFI